MSHQEVDANSPSHPLDGLWEATWESCQYGDFRVVHKHKFVVHEHKFEFFKCPCEIKFENNSCPRFVWPDTVSSNTVSSFPISMESERDIPFSRNPAEKPQEIVWKIVGGLKFWKITWRRSEPSPFNTPNRRANHPLPAETLPEEHQQMVDSLWDILGTAQEMSNLSNVPLRQIVPPSPIAPIPDSRIPQSSTTIEDSRIPHTSESNVSSRTSESTTTDDSRIPQTSNSNVYTNITQAQAAIIVEHQTVHPYQTEAVVQAEFVCHYEDGHETTVGSSYGGESSMYEPTNDVVAEATVIESGPSEKVTIAALSGETPEAFVLPQESDSNHLEEADDFETKATMSRIDTEAAIDSISQSFMEPNQSPGNSCSVVESDNGNVTRATVVDHNVHPADISTSSQADLIGNSSENEDAAIAVGTMSSSMEPNQSPGNICSVVKSDNGNVTRATVVDHNVHPADISTDAAMSSSNISDADETEPTKEVMTLDHAGISNELEIVPSDRNHPNLLEDLPELSSKLSIPPGGQCPLYEQDQQHQIAESLGLGGCSHVPEKAPEVQEGERPDVPFDEDTKMPPHYPSDQIPELGDSKTDHSSVEKRKGIEECQMKSSISGKAWELVTGAMALQTGCFAVIGEDDMMPLAERFLKAQMTFRFNNIPWHVDIAYHHTRSDNLRSIQTDGLLSFRERTERNIHSNSNGSSYGDGIYCSSDPFRHAKKGYGNVTILLARMRGIVSSTQETEETFNTLVLPHRDTDVLQCCDQCLPLFYFPSSRLLSRSTFRDNLYEFDAKVQALLDKTLWSTLDYTTPIQGVPAETRNLQNMTSFESKIERKRKWKSFKTQGIGRSREMLRMQRMARQDVHPIRKIEAQARLEVLENCDLWHFRQHFDFCPSQQTFSQRSKPDQQLPSIPPVTLDEEIPTESNVPASDRHQESETQAPEVENSSPQTDQSIPQQSNTEPSIETLRACHALCGLYHASAMSSERATFDHFDHIKHEQPDPWWYTPQIGKQSKDEGAMVPLRSAFRV